MRGIKKYIALISAISIVIFIEITLDWRKVFLISRPFPIVEIQSDTSEIFSSKLWLHRVNSFARLLEATKEYKGMEIDIHYDATNNNFYIAHDPYPENYIYLDEFLSSIGNIEDYYIWLDFKNLKEENHEYGLNCLTTICKELQIDLGNIIVESKNAHYLSEYTLSGFNTSYYLPIFDPYEVSDEKIRKYALEIDSMLMKSNVTFVSADYKLYHFIKEYFPETSMLLWQTHSNLLAPYLRKKILNDPNVKVLLIS